MQHAIHQTVNTRPALRYFGLLVLLCCAGLAWAQNAFTEEARKTAIKQLDEADQALEKDTVTPQQLRDWPKILSAIKQNADACVSSNNQASQKTKADLATIGEPTLGEPDEVSKKRKALQEDQAKYEKALAACRLLLLRSENILKKLTELEQSQLAQRLLAHGPDVFALAKQNWEQPKLWYDSTKTFLFKHSGLERLSSTQWVTLIALLFVMTGAGVALRRYLLRWLGQIAVSDSLSNRFARAVLAVLAHYVPHFLVTASAAVACYVIAYGVRPVPFINILAYGLPAYFVLVALIQLFLAPHPPAEPFLNIPAEVGKALARRLTVLVLLVFIGYLLFATLVSQSLPKEAFLLARAIFAGVFVLNLIWALWLLGRIPRLRKTPGIRAGLPLVLLATLMAEWLGYRNLSAFVVQALFGTVLLFGLASMLSRMLRELWDGLDTGRHNWHRKLRRFMGVPSGAPIPGLAWVRFALAAVLWIGFAVITLRGFWDLPDAVLQHLKDAALNGFTIGSLKIVPTRILFAFLALALLLTANSWLRARMERDWLLKTRMNRGAREAMTAISGYVGLAIAVLVALSVAGMEFGNLAIIAGALSVGIGFGLQNIVNNFVSGLILLFERPIKTGDWIIVGSTEGYVKRISIRSTQIQTFDRADVIVPNSELISGQVTNWMLYDHMGRIRVPVGVAYGSDTALVKRLLLEAANAHADIITTPSGPYPEPQVMFLAFGDSSLNFELRAHIKNIDRRLHVISDLNFAIDAAFREHGVEIPFPQRDVHVRDWPPAAGDPSSLPAAGAEPGSAPDRKPPASPA